MEKIEIKDFEKLNLRVGKIKAVKEHPKVNEYILLIDLGIADQDLQIVADLKESYKIEDLVGKEVIVVENIKPTTIEGVESQGLLLITHKEGKPVLISPEVEVLPGVKVYGIQDSEFCYHLKE